MPKRAAVAKQIVLFTITQFPPFARWLVTTGTESILDTVANSMIQRKLGRKRPGLTYAKRTVQEEYMLWYRDDTCLYIGNEGK